jgi:hypothetical protein
MEHLKYLAATVALLVNIPLFLGILNGTVKDQSFSTWILWAALDILTTITIVLNHGNWYLSGAYIVSSFAISGILFLKKQIDWSAVDTYTAIGVFICLVVWGCLGSKAATIAGTTAVVISGYPLS